MIHSQYFYESCLMYTGVSSASPFKLHIVINLFQTLIKAVYQVMVCIQVTPTNMSPAQLRKALKASVWKKNFPTCCLL